MNSSTNKRSIFFHLAWRMAKLVVAALGIYPVVSILYSTFPKWESILSLTLMMLMLIGIYLNSMPILAIPLWTFIFYAIGSTSINTSSFDLVGILVGLIFGLICDEAEHGYLFIREKREQA